MNKLKKTNETIEENQGKGTKINGKVKKTMNKWKKKLMNTWKQIATDWKLECRMPLKYW